MTSHSSTTCTSSDVASETENEKETSFSAANAQMHTSPGPSVHSCPSPQTIINQDQESLGNLGGDIGKVYNKVHSLDNKVKYSLLKTPFVPNSSYNFPATADEYGKKRRFQHSWLHFFPGLVYSQCTNGGFCKFCVLFGRSESGQLGILVSRRLINFRKASEILRDHFCAKHGKGKLSHINAVSDSFDSWSKQFSQ